MTIIPIAVGSADDSVDTLMDLMAAECSAKEVVMAVEEVVENLERRLQSGDEEDDHDEAKHASAPRQIIRLIRAYTASKYSSDLTGLPLTDTSVQQSRGCLNGESPQRKPSSHGCQSWSLSSGTLVPVLLQRKAAA